MLAAQIKAAKILFTEENCAILKELEGDLHSLVNFALEQFVRGLRDNQDTEEPETGA